MKKLSTYMKLMATACALALGVALVGCASPGGTSGTQAQQANRAYMSQVNETMVELDEGLDQFADAVSRADVVNMKTQADNAYKALDKLAKIEAPEEMKGVHDCYVDGSGKLRSALDGYIALYSELAKDPQTDKADYDKRIAELQSLYDEGIAALQKGDETAAGAEQSSSSSVTVSSIAAPASDSAQADSGSAQVDSASSSTA